MTAPALGVDPGKTGGACLLASDGRTVLATWHWRPSEWASVVWSSLRDDPCWKGGLYGVTMQVVADVRELLGPHPDLTVAVEGLFVPSGRTHGVLELAEATGELIGPIRSFIQGEPLRPRAAVWRPAVLGLAPNTEAAKAEAAAVRAVRAGLVAGLPELEDGHVAEAACIARWGWATARGSAQLELVGRGR